MKLKFNKPVNNIFDKIKEYFDPSRLTYDVDDYDDRYTYELEETDSVTGFIRVVIYNNTDIVFPFAFTLYVDDQEITCSRILRRTIYRFFKKKMKEPYLIGINLSLNEFVNKFT